MAALRLKMEAKEVLGQSWSPGAAFGEKIGRSLLEKRLLIEDLKTIWKNGEMLGLAILM